MHGTFAMHQVLPSAIDILPPGHDKQDHVPLAGWYLLIGQS